MPHLLPSSLSEGCDGLLLCYAKWAYDVTQGLWWAAMLLGFCVALMAATYRFGTTRSFGYGSFAGLNGAIFLATLGLMSWWVASAFILIGVIGVVVMVMREE